MALASGSYVVAGLGFGDEGKGTVTDLLVRETGAKAVVRYNGGPQAGHNVVDPDGRWHCFAQLGAGSFVPGTGTLLAPQMLVELENLQTEAEVLAGKGVAEPLSRVTVDPGCPLVTPMHKMLGQIAEESRGDRRFGTCGMGVGEAVRGQERGEGLVVGDLLAGRAGLAKLEGLRQLAMARAEKLAAERPSDRVDELLRYFRTRCDAPSLFLRYTGILERCRVAPVAGSWPRGPLVFEGAQGALLDRRHGFAPFVTQSRATVHNALDLLGDAPATKVGVLRAYGHRHGPGPFPTEDGRLGKRLADPYNRENRWQGRFRLGRLDLVMLRYGLRLNGGVDWLAVTGLDRLTGLDTVRLCTSYLFEGDTRLLEGWTLWEPSGRRRARITQITGRYEGMPPQAAEVLQRCRPFDWLVLPGWRADLRGCRKVDDLPGPARQFLSLLEGPRGLATPLGVVSVGPDASGKLLLAG